jgi:hypothetical protein
MQLEAAYKSNKLCIRLGSSYPHHQNRLRQIYNEIHSQHGTWLTLQLDRSPSYNSRTIRSSLIVLSSLLLIAVMEPLSLILLGLKISRQVKLIKYY